MLLSIQSFIPAALFTVLSSFDTTHICVCVYMDCIYIKYLELQIYEDRDTMLTSSIIVLSCQKPGSNNRDLGVCCKASKAKMSSRMT